MRKTFLGENQDFYQYDGSFAGFMAKAGGYNMEPKELFEDWLEKNKAFDKWCKRVASHGTKIEDALNYINNEFNAPQVLDDGIIFFYKNHGDKGYWNNLNLRWKEYLDAKSNNR